MAVIQPHDRVLEYSTSNSQTVFAVTGAPNLSCNAFSAFMSIGDTVIGGVVEEGVAFKSGVLTYSAIGQVTVTVAFESKGTFSAGGTKQVFMGFPASLAGFNVVRPELFGGGIGVADNKAALDAAIASSGAGAVRVQFGPGIYTFTTTPALIAKNNVIIEGAGEDVTILQWSSGTLIEANSGFSEAQGFQLRNLTLYSTDTTTAKTALKLVDQSHSILENVKIIGAGGSNSLLTGSGGCHGIYSQGRDFLITKNVTIYADIPVRLGMNPNHYIAADHYHLEDMFLVGGTSYPIVQVDPGVIMSSVTLNGFSFDLGTHGFYYNDTAAANAVTAINNGGAGHHAGDVITLAGGTFSTAITIRVLSVAAGVITAASVLNPGIYSVLPTYPASQGSTTGSGTGATFTLTCGASSILTIADSRFEQGSSAASTSIYISPSAGIDTVKISNTGLGGDRKGVYLRRAKHTTLELVKYTPITATLAVDADASNECLVLENCDWQTGSTDNITLPYVSKSDTPTGESSGTNLSPCAVYSNTMVAWKFQTLTSPIFNAKLAAASTGYAQLFAGDSTHTGYFAWIDQTTTRHAYMGYDTSGVGLTLNMEVGDFTVSNGNIFGTAGIQSKGATAGIGYATGAGGTITQPTNKSTTVTLNKVSGAITMNNAALAAGAIVTFGINNTASAATDVLVLNHISGGTAGAYLLNARCQAGSIAIDVRNTTAGLLSEAIVIQYVLIKAVNA